MRKRRINRVKDLPEWFDIKKYGFAKHLDVEGWLNQSVVRRMEIPERFLTLTEDGKFAYESDPKVLKEFHQWRQDRLNLIRERGIVSIDKAEQADLLKDFMEASEISGGARPTTLLEIQWAAHKIPPGEFDHTEAIYEDDHLFFNPLIRARMDSDPFYSRHFIHSDQNTIAFYKPEVFFTIDLSVSDKVILDQLKKELKLIRDELEIPKEQNQINDTVLYRWAEFGLLPYFDLAYWALENNVTIPNRVYADAIFPDGNKGEDVIRKITKSLMQNFIQNDTIIALCVAYKNPDYF